MGQTKEIELVGDVIDGTHYTVPEHTTRFEKSCLMPGGFGLLVYMATGRKTAEGREVFESAGREPPPPPWQPPTEEE